MNDIPIVVINMEKNYDRLEKIDRNLNDVGLKFQRFDAIDGSKLEDSFITSVTTYSCKKFTCTRSQVGCALSHKTVWNNFKDGLYGNSNYLCILEDDAEVNKDFVEFLKNFSTTFTFDFDFFSLYCQGMCTLGGDELVIGKYKIVKNPMLPLGFVAYIISRQCAAKVCCNKIYKSIDWMIALEKSLNHYVLMQPTLVKTSLESSTINGSKGSQCIINTLVPVKGLNWYLNLNVINWNMQNLLSLYEVVLIVLIIVCVWKKYVLLATVFTAELIMFKTF